MKNAVKTMPNLEKCQKIQRILKYKVSCNNGEKYVALDALKISHDDPGHGHFDDCVVLLPLVADHVLPAPPHEDGAAPQIFFRDRLNPVKYYVLKIVFLADA